MTKFYVRATYSGYIEADTAEAAAENLPSGFAVNKLKAQGYLDYDMDEVSELSEA